MSGHPVRPRWSRWVRRTSRVLVVVVVGVPLFVAGSLAAALAMVLYGDLPGTVPEEHERVVARPTVVLDASGAEIGEFREFDLTVPVTPEDIPLVLSQAVVASEDRNFWEHDGVDLEGILRAAVANVRSGDVVQGGSTITQQLVKNRYLSAERTFERKLDEAILASRLEQEMSKDEILFEYLDTTYFGGGAYGVGAAAQTYFHKPVSELTLSESALLVGLIPAPSDLDPRLDPFGAEAARQRVLGAMLEVGFIDQPTHDAARAEMLWYAGLGAPDRPATVYHPPREVDPGTNPYFLDYVRRELVDRFGAEAVHRGGLVVETTLDPAAQQAAERAVTAALEGTEAPVDMTLVAVEPRTGHVRAFIGGRDWEASQVNLALGGSLGMQPGSSFKPFVLTAALEAGIHPDDTRPAPGSWEVPGCVGACTVANYNGRDYGEMSVRNATWSSVNTLYSSLTHELGPTTVAETARRLGVESIDPSADHGVSLALGSAEVAPLDLAAGYATLAAGGLRATPTPIRRVLDADGLIMLDNTLPRAERVVDEAVAAHVTDVLTGVITYGTGTAADLGRPAAGKTGTAEDYRAAWFAGYTPQLTAVVWMGHADEPRPLEDVAGHAAVTGGTLPAAAWAAFMGEVHADLEVLAFAEPGPLPSPPGVLVVEAPERRSPQVAPSCGGLCETAPAPATLPPPESEVAPDPDPDPEPDADPAVDAASTEPSPSGPEEHP